MKSRKFTCSHCGAIKVITHSSQYTGVSWDKVHKRFRTRVTQNGKQVSLSYFKDEVNAAVAYDEYVLANGLIDKPLNFPHGRLQ